MLAAIELLSNQPTAWPKWEVGLNADDLPTETKHLFMFDPAEFGDGFGRAVAACQFVDGATYVSRCRWDSDKPQASGHCHDCLEVRLQQWLQTHP